MKRTLEFGDGESHERVAGELAVRLAERTRQAERDRRISDETVQLLSHAGLFRVSTPRRHDGLCLSVASAARIAAALARGCPSTAWIYCVSNSNTLTASLASPALQRDVFSKGVPIICGAASPSGTTQPTEGGRVVDGRWAYSSGCAHAQWGAFAVADKAPGGAPLGATVYLPMTEVSIEDTWHVAGLKATGSNTVVAKGAFVPTHRYALPGQGGGEPLEASDFVGVVPHFRSLLLGVMVGIGEAILDLVRTRAKAQGIVFTTYSKQSESQVVQHDLGEAAVALRAARLLMVDAANAIDNAAAQQHRLSGDERAWNRAQTAHAASSVVQAAGRLVGVAGSWAFAEANPVQQLWRDLHVAASHAIMISRVGYEILGRALLEVPGITPSEELI